MGAAGPPPLFKAVQARASKIYQSIWSCIRGATEGSVHVRCNPVDPSAPEALQTPRLENM